MKKIVFIFGLVFLSWSCEKDGDENPQAEDELTAEQLQFIEEYEYITFNLSPTSFGANVNEKWTEEIRLYLNGTISASYANAVENELQRLNEFFSDGTQIVLVQNINDANVQLFQGPESDIETLWPDMYDFISQGNFSGYALYNRGGAFNITSGRIWVKNDGMPIFTHELGHIIGLGHSSDLYCNQDSGPNRSFMCSSLANGYSKFDAGVIKVLYHPEIEIGKPFSELEPVIEDLLLTRKVIL